mmetsp:Transcript_133443/g.231934  ORF Transcript_133443/g.231934 Transcript_133443/m.231934 type:complete len:448 (-) Transcript_133443:33-1376(-)
MDASAASATYGALSVTELRRELARRGISADGCVEKSDLVERLASSTQTSARAEGPRSSVPSELGGLSVAELRRELARKGISADGCVEKADLVERLSAAAGVTGSSSSSSSRTQPDSEPAASATKQTPMPPLATLSVPELRNILGRHGAQVRAESVREKSELVAAVSDCLRCCPICLEDVEAHQSVENVGERSSVSQSCGHCRAGFHRTCAAKYALSAAEAGKLPLLCPVHQCRERWPGEIVAAVLSPDELNRYNAAVRSVRELRNQQYPAAVEQRARERSPRTRQALKELGVRVCPQCHSEIEKQAGGIVHGCDKMTCRCGCRFCFVCGKVARKDGNGRYLPSCSCVGENHSYLEHGSVVNNYSDMPDIPTMADAQNAAQQFAQGAANIMGGAFGADLGQAFNMFGATLGNMFQQSTSAHSFGPMHQGAAAQFFPQAGQTRRPYGAS